MDLQSTQKNDQLCIQKSQLLLEYKMRNSKQKERTILTPEEMNEHFKSLLKVEQQKEESIFLQNYFKKNPFDDSYDKELINILLSFFDPSSEFGIEGVNLSSSILCSIFTNEKNTIVQSLLTTDFYQIIWPYFDQSNFVILIFQYAMILEVNSINPTAYNFLMDNEIFKLIDQLLKQEEIFIVHIICFIATFDIYFGRCKGELIIDSYEECMKSIFNLIPTICQLTFTSSDIDLFEYGCCCLSIYGYHYVDIGLAIFENINFQQKCQSLKKLDKDNQNEVKELLLMIDKILQNETVHEQENYFFEKGSEIRFQIKPHNSFILELITKIINSQNSENVDAKDFEFFLNLSLSVLSHLYYTDDEINNFIESGFIQQLLENLKVNNSFHSKRIIFEMIGTIIEFSNVEIVKFFIDNDLINYITDCLDELMTEIPYKIISIFGIINRYAEMNDDYSNWNNLLFDNEEIIKALDKASKGEYSDPKNSNVSLILYAQSFLSRRYN